MKSQNSDQNSKLCMDQLKNNKIKQEINIDVDYLIDNINIPSSQNEGFILQQEDQQDGTISDFSQSSFRNEISNEKDEDDFFSEESLINDPLITQNQSNMRELINLNISNIEKKSQNDFYNKSINSNIFLSTDKQSIRKQNFQCEELSLFTDQSNNPNQSQNQRKSFQDSSISINNSLMQQGNREDLLRKGSAELQSNYLYFYKNLNLKKQLNSSFQYDIKSPLSSMRKILNKSVDNVEKRNKEELENNIRTSDENNDFDDDEELLQEYECFQSQNLKINTSVTLISDFEKFQKIQKIKPSDLPKLKISVDFNAKVFDRYFDHLHSLSQIINAARYFYETKSYTIFAQQDGSLVLYNNQNQSIKTINQDQQYSNSITSLHALEPYDILLVGFNSGRLSIFDLQSGMLVKTFKSIHQRAILQGKFIEISDLNLMKFQILSSDINGNVIQTKFEKSYFSSYLSKSKYIFKYNDQIETQEQFCKIEICQQN